MYFYICVRYKQVDTEYEGTLTEMCGRWTNISILNTFINQGISYRILSRVYGFVVTASNNGQSFPFVLKPSLNGGSLPISNSTSIVACVSVA
jgi:hypothetical protein